MRNMEMKVGDLLRRVLPAFEKVPTELYEKSGFDFESLAQLQVASIEVCYSLDPLPPDHMIDFTLRPVIDEAKVTLGEDQDEKSSDLNSHSESESDAQFRH